MEKSEAVYRKKYNDFDVRQYGYSSLSTFIDEIDSFVLIKENNTVHVALKEDNDVKEKVVQFAKEYVKKPEKKRHRFRCSRTENTWKIS